MTIFRLTRSDITPWYPETKRAFEKDSQGGFGVIHLAGLNIQGKRVVKSCLGPQPDMRDGRGMPEVEKVPQRLARVITSRKAYANQKTLLAGLRWLRANRALGRVESEGFDPFWVVTKHADISEIIRQHDLRSEE